MGLALRKCSNFDLWTYIRHELNDKWNFLKTKPEQWLGKSHVVLIFLRECWCRLTPEPAGLNSILYDMANNLCKNAKSAKCIILCSFTSCHWPGHQQVSIHSMEDGSFMRWSLKIQKKMLLPKQKETLDLRSFRCSSSRLSRLDVIYVHPCWQFLWSLVDFWHICSIASSRCPWCHCRSRSSVWLVWRIRWSPKTVPCWLWWGPFCRSAALTRTRAPANSPSTETTRATTWGTWNRESAQLRKFNLPINIRVH